MLWVGHFHNSERTACWDISQATLLSLPKEAVADTQEKTITNYSRLSCTTRVPFAAPSTSLHWRTLPIPVRAHRSSLPLTHTSLPVRKGDTPCCCPNRCSFVCWGQTFISFPPFVSVFCTPQSKSYKGKRDFIKMYQGVVVDLWRICTQILGNRVNGLAWV